MVKVLCYKSEGRWFDPRWCQWIFHWHKILPIALCPWGRLSLWQKWVPGAFPGGKGGRCVRLTTLPLFCAVVIKPGNLNFLEPSEPLQACKGTALSFILTDILPSPWSTSKKFLLSGFLNGLLYALLMSPTRAMIPDDTTFLYSTVLIVGIKWM